MNVYKIELIIFDDGLYSKDQLLLGISELLSKAEISSQVHAIGNTEISEDIINADDDILVDILDEMDMDLLC